MDTFQGTTVLITGAGTGIGRAMALLLAKEQADLALVDINAETLQDTQSRCRAEGARAEACRCDMGAQADIEDMLARVSGALGPVDILINNAATVVGKQVHRYEYEDLKHTMLVNFVGAAYLTRLVLPAMMACNRGHIVNMASVIGLMAMLRMGDYVASKFAMVGFTDTLRRELKKAGCSGVRTLCVCPTGVDTGLFPGYKAPPLVPLLTSEDVARAVVKAIRRDRPQLQMPLLAKVIPALRLLPVSVQDAILQATGFSGSMDGFRARR